MQLTHRQTEKYIGIVRRTAKTLSWYADQASKKGKTHAHIPIKELKRLADNLFMVSPTIPKNRIKKDINSATV